MQVGRKDGQREGKKEGLLGNFKKFRTLRQAGKKARQQAGRKDI
jgi:hypothetical protein